MVNIRDWARKKGISDSDIEYDPATKKIKVRGVDYGKGTPIYGKQMTDMRSPSGTSLIGRKPVSVQTGTKFNEEVLDDTFNRGNLADAQRQVQTAKNQYMNTLTKGYTPGVFQYNQAKDPAYASAMSNAQQNIRNAQIQNLGDMQRRGLLNSSIATDRANQISADEIARIETQIAPQLEERAYNRYLQNEGMKRNKWQDDVQRLAAALGITKDAREYSQGIVDIAEQKRQAIADSLSKTYDTAVKPTVITDDMYKQVQGMKTVAQKEAERKLAEEQRRRQDAIDERNAKSALAQADRQAKMDALEKEISAKITLSKQERDAIARENEKKRSFEKEQNALNRAAAAKARASSGGGGKSSGGSKTSGAVSASTGKQAIDFKNVKVVDDMIRDRFKVGGSSSSGIDMPIVMSGSGSTTPTIGMTSTASMKALDNASKKTVRNMIDRSNLNYSERAYLYDTYGLGKRWNDNFKPTANAPAGSDWRAKEELGKQNIAVYVNKLPISEEDKVAMYEDMKRWYGYVN